MKKKELKTLRGKTRKALREQLEKKRKDFILAWAEIRGGKEKNVNKARGIKKDIARLMTIIREKELIEENKRIDSEKDKGDSKNE